VDRLLTDARIRRSFGAQTGPDDSGTSPAREHDPENSNQLSEKIMLNQDARA
jgi:hypothetical protein